MLVIRGGTKGRTKGSELSSWKQEAVPFLFVLYRQRDDCLCDVLAA